MIKSEKRKTADKLDREKSKKKQLVVGDHVMFWSLIILNAFLVILTPKFKRYRININMESQRTKETEEYERGS